MLPVLLLPRPHGVYWVCGLGWVCSRKPRRMLALSFLPFFKDSVDEIETGGENRDGSVLVRADPSLGTELGLSRIQYPASGNSESQGVESLSRPINLHQAIRSHKG
ncbi:hypothetical protein Pmani_025112 [Petrolisthes manimaculis]|uniref:Uncharacterized protein n=1 Tax=Petrolisthes manimaculis TaxID=1843537 RepID=A0AAE1TZ95_9EUCA|nr:hypothetical protein Pmani_025112 [Petrolisthes manimaculis]